MVLVDDYTLEVYQNTTSFFAFHYINSVPILPRHIWEEVGPNWQDFDPVTEGKLIGLGPWKFVKYVPGEYVHLVANEKYWKFPDRFYQGLSVSEIQQANEITALKIQLEEALIAGEEAAETLSELGTQLSSLEESTRQLLEASAEDINSLETEISTLTSALQTETAELESKVSRLEAGLSSASNIGYASIGIAVIVGIVAIFMSRRSI